jgi:hypothetical protein
LTYSDVFGKKQTLRWGWSVFNDKIVDVKETGIDLLIDEWDMLNNNRISKRSTEGRK